MPWALVRMMNRVLAPRKNAERGLKECRMSWPGVGW